MSLAPRTQPAVRPSAVPFRVMVVDDSAVIRGLVGRWLAADPAVQLVASCPNGKVAVNEVARIRPEVVILDIEMPEMDGLSFLKALRARQGGASPVVLFCTTENDMKHITDALAAGANEYIMKPFDRGILESKFAQAGLTA